jgi:hypothetical protein
MGFSLGSLLPAAAGFLVGGPIGAELGLEGGAASAVGGALAGGATSALTGGNFLSGALGGGLGGYADTFGGLAGLTGAGLGTGAGFAETPGGLNVLGSELGGGTIPAGAGEGGSILDSLRQRFGQLGFGGSPWTQTAGGLNVLSGEAGGAGGAGLFGGKSNPLLMGLGGLELLGGLQQYQAGQQQLGLQRGYAQQLQNLMANPSSALTTPTYLAGEQALRRSMASQGYQGSGNMAAALAGLGGQAYTQQANLLSSLATPRMSIGSPMGGLGSMGLGGLALLGGLG